LIKPLVARSARLEALVADRAGSHRRGPGRRRTQRGQSARRATPRPYPLDRARAPLPEYRRVTPPRRAVMPPVGLRAFLSPLHDPTGHESRCNLSGSHDPYGSYHSAFPMSRDRYVHPPAAAQGASWSSPAAGRRRRRRACALPSPACHIRLAALTRRSPPTKTQALQRRPLRIPGSVALCRRAAPRPGERHPGSR
jgi:hypothetical protein